MNCTEQKFSDYVQEYTVLVCIQASEAKFLVPDWGIWSTMAEGNRTIPALQAIFAGGPERPWMKYTKLYPPARG